jgi:hypothetical protein
VFWLGLLVLGIYFTILGLFITGYRYTTFQRGLLIQLTLSLLWPILVITYPRFRRNFQRALERDRSL